MRGKSDLFVGVTSWNSKLFLPHCLRALKYTVDGMDARVVVLDNASADGSAQIAGSLDAEVIVRRCTQGDALNRLFRESRSRFTLLIHADVILLGKDWYGLCASKIAKDRILVSPEDIGCGPYTRPFGAGMPESSFLFFDTVAMSKAKAILWRKTRFFPLPRRVLDFYGHHVTHNLPERLRRRGLSWFRMDVHVSDRVPHPIYDPPFEAPVWSEELGHLRYGLGNFYSIDGAITHYHNWYDRIDANVPADSTLTTHSTGRGFPTAYVKAYTNAFLEDYSAGRLVVPAALRSDRRPVAL